MFYLTGGGIVCSEPLARQAACERAAACNPSDCALVVEDRYFSLFEARGLHHTPARFFTSHSVLGNIPMFWTLLYRAWCVREGKTPRL